VTSAGVAIQFDHLSKSYGGRAVLSDVTFEAGPGRVTALLGPNGAGKSTALRVLLGLVHPDSGRATFGGKVRQALRTPCTVVGATLEGDGAHPGRSGLDHLLIQAYATHTPREVVDSAVLTVGLLDAIHRRVGTYSLGMRQRLAIASALLGDPPALVFDEPTNGLDPGGIAWIRSLLLDQARRGRTVLVSSHMLAELEQSVDDVVIIDHGVVKLQSSLDRLRRGPRTRVLARTTDDQTLVAAMTAEGVGSAVRDAGLVEIATDDPIVVVRIADRHGISLTHLSTEASSLEQVYMETISTSPTRATQS